LSTLIALRNLIFEEAAKMNGEKKGARQIVTYRMKNGSYKPDKNSIVPSDSP
jgi:hypothetical protein